MHDVGLAIKRAILGMKEACSSNLQSRNDDFCLGKYKFLSLFRTLGD